MIIVSDSLMMNRGRGHTDQLIGGALDPASHAPQLMSCNYYVHVYSTYIHVY